MKLPYDGIFREEGAGEDAEEIACGLTNAFTRFLLATATFPHTFWQGGQRVILSDVEQQIIESGLAALTELESDMATITFRGQASSHQVTESGVAATVLVNMTQIDTEKASFDGQTGVLSITENGLYLFTAQTRIEDPLSPPGPYRILCQARRPTGLVHWAVDRFYSGAYEDMSIAFVLWVQQPEDIILQFLQDSGQQVSLRWPNTRIEVFHIGKSPG